MSTFIFSFSFLFVFGMLATASRSYIRAKHNKPYGIKHGMVIEKATGKLMGTETDVMTDPVSGIQWFGKTKFVDKSK